jgi:CBS domain-containing protein
LSAGAEGVDDAKEMFMATVTARDLMIPLDQYPHIPYWFTLRQAIAEIEMAVLEIDGRSSLPRALLVFDEKYELVGIVRRRDILAGLEPTFLQIKKSDSQTKLFDIEIDPNLVDLSSATDTMKAQAEKSVSEVMRPIEDTCDIDEVVAKIIYKMVAHDLSLLPVLNDQKVVGVVRSVDVFNRIASLLL